MADESNQTRDWIKILLAALAIIVTIGLSLNAVINDIQRTTARHDAEHAGFRDDISELRERCKTDCKK